MRVVAVNEDGKVRLSLKPPVRTRAPKGSTAIRPDTGVPRRDFADLAVDQWLDGVVVRPPPSIPPLQPCSRLATAACCPVSASWPPAYTSNPVPITLWG